MSDWKPVVLSLPDQLTPAISLELVPHGLTVHRILVQKDGRTNDIVVSPEDPKHHLEKKYVNTVIGRYTNRIPVGTHNIERNGIKGEFTAQANESERVSLHGGPVGFDSKVWTQLSESDTPTLFTKAELAHLPASSTSHAFFRLISEDGDQGFPGKLITEVLAAVVSPGDHTITPEKRDETNIGSVVFIYRAKLDTGDKKVVTPVNLTQHWGFNLDASLDDHKQSVKEHSLTLNSDRIVDRDADSLSKGRFINIEKDAAHNHNGKLVGEGYPDKAGYDDCYVFRTPTSPVLPTRLPLSSFNSELDLIKDIIAPTTDAPNPVQEGRAAPVASLSSKKSGLKLDFDTNQSAVMFYSNGWADPKVGGRKKIHGGSGSLGSGYEPGSAVFLEFHEPLTAFLQPEFKDKEDTLLTSDEVYNNYTRLDIKSLEQPISV